MNKTNNKVLNEWTIKEDESNIELFGDVERRELLLQKLKLTDENIKKAINKMHLEGIEKGILDKTKDKTLVMKKLIEDVKDLEERILPALKRSHGIEINKTDFVFDYKPERSLLLVTEYLEE